MRDLIMNIKNINTHHNKVKTRLVSYNDIGDLSEYLQDLHLTEISHSRHVWYLSELSIGSCL